MKKFRDYILDLETSGKRGWHGLRSKFNPPRITQIAMIQLDPTNPRNHKIVIGKGAGRGWTDIIGKLVEKHRPMSELKLSPAFWRDAMRYYDPSVRVKGSILNDQIRRHVREYLALKKTGQTGEMKSAQEYLKAIKSTFQKDIDAGYTVRLSAYNKGFDVNQMVNEMNRAGKVEGQAFTKWLDKHVASGAIEMRGVEEGLHRGMFEVMLKDASLVPRYSSSQYFAMASKAGVEKVGLEATILHQPLRELVDDIGRMKAGQDAGEVLRGLPQEVQKELKGVRTYDDWTKFRDYMKATPSAEKAVVSHYGEKAFQKTGSPSSKYVKTMGFEFISGWRQEAAAKAAGLKAVTHDALSDTFTSKDLKNILSGKVERQRLAKHVLSNKEFLLEEVNVKYSRYLQESGREATNALKVGLKTAKVSPVVLSRLARSPLTLPILATAGGLALANSLMSKDRGKLYADSLRQEMKGKIQGLRRSTSQWDQQHGINPSKMAGANVSFFGSGRYDEVWDRGSYKGVPFSPGVYDIRAHLARNPQLVRRVEEGKLRSSKPNKVGPTQEELQTSLINLADYIYEVKDADSIILRKAWLNRNIPVIGPIFGFLQRQLQNMAKTLTGNDLGFEVRVAGVDAPELEHGGKRGDWLGGQRGGEEATDYMRKLMAGRATHIVLEPSSMTYGRYVGTPFAGQKNIAAELVRGGGAIALTIGKDRSEYYAQEQVAASRGSGIWQYPEYQGILEARKRGIEPVMNRLQKMTELGRFPKTAAVYSLMAYARNPQLHGVRDQYAQNSYLRGF